MPAGRLEEAATVLHPLPEFFEPRYEAGKALRRRIRLADGQPTAIAGLWRAWEEPDGRPSHSFTTLTVNADEHPLRSRMYQPVGEKRSVVVIRPSEYPD